MSQNRRYKRKVRKRRIDKKKVIILIVAIVLLISVACKVVQGTINISKNILTKFTAEKQQQQEVVVKDQFDLSTEVDKSIDSEFTVLIDAGHGGYDKGTMTSDKSVLEKDITLEIAKMVAKRLSTEKDVQVIVSRTNDTFLSLSERSSIANKQEVDLFVSIHLNSQDGSTDAHGTETYYSKNDSKELASSVQQSITSYIDTRDRGIKYSSFQILNECTMPSILIEAGFLSNPEEASRLQDTNHQNQLSEGIVQGILSYLDQNRKK